MYISEIRVKGFGKLKDFELAPGSGINLITGMNEAGKTTLHLFIKSMFYGLSTKRKAGQKSDFDRMRPWQEPEVYGGTLGFYSLGALYRIERDFARSADDLALYEIRGDEAKAVDHPAEKLSELLGSVSESAYSNTLFVRQSGIETDRSLADEIIGYAANTETTANPALSALRSIEYLSKIKRELQAGIEPDAHRSYNITLGRIRALRDELNSGEHANGIIAAAGRRDDASARVDEVAVQKSAKEDEIRATEDLLSGTGIDSALDTEALIEDVSRSFGDYEKRKKRVPVYRTLGVILLILAAAAAVIGLRLIDVPALSVIREYYEAQSYLSYAVTIAVALIGFILIVLASSEQGRALGLEGRLNEILDHHLSRDSSGTVTDQDIDAFMTRAGEYREVSRRLDSLRSEREELVRSLSRASDEYNLRIKELDRELRTKEGVEEKMLTLNRLSDEAEILKRRTERNEALSTEIEAVEMAADTITELSRRISASAGSYINKEAGRMIEGLTAGRYSSVNVGAGLDVSLMGSGGMIPVRELSQGTMDQVYLALRLAAGRLAMGGKDELPLLMDDSFAMYDDERLIASLRFIAEQYAGQVMIFSCQGREAAALDALSIPHKRMGM